jgi:hypothetical protein
MMARILRTILPSQNVTVSFSSDATTVVGKTIAGKSQLVGPETARGEMEWIDVASISCSGIYGHMRC